MGKKYIGIDIGGTNLKAGLVDEDGTLLATAKEPLSWTSPEDFVKKLAELSKKAAHNANISEREICGVGMGVPGEVDAEQGRVLYTCNIPLSDLDITKVFRRELDVPVYLGNDADCAALGELYAGAGRGLRNLIVITLGTGVGAGIILNGKLLRGVNGAAGEVGHMVIVPNGQPCPCGRRGCWEQYSSATALKRLTREAMQEHPESALWKHCGGDLSKIGGRSAFQMAKDCGDETARSVCDQYVSYLALGVTNLINLFQPEMICIGGGVSNEEDAALLHPLQRIVARERFGCRPEPCTKVVKAKLGNDAGIIGAALLAREGEKEQEAEAAADWTAAFDALLAEKAPSVRTEADAVMAKYTSFRIGGPAKRMVFPKSEEETALLVELCKEVGVNFLVLGKGSNLLIADEGLDGVVLNMTELSKIEVREDGILYAQAGAQLSRIASAAQNAGLAGFAFAHGIPGSLGGAVVMNAGAYGGEMKQVLRSVTALFEDGVRTLQPDELELGYRHSVFSGGEGIVLSAEIVLEPGEKEEIRAEMDDLMARRKKSQPLEFPSAGSTFKRPEGHFAGTMIDQCGLKGTCVGGAEVSPKHAGFVINKGGATCADVLGLIAVVQKKVEKEFGVLLEPEVKIIRSL